MALEPFHSVKIIFSFPLLILKGTDFTTGHIFIFPSGPKRKWKTLMARKAHPPHARWMTCEGAFSLDQTRVHLRSDQSFRRDQLRAASHQAREAAKPSLGPPVVPFITPFLGEGSPIKMD